MIVYQGFKITTTIDQVSIKAVMLPVKFDETTVQTSLLALDNALSMKNVCKYMPICCKSLGERVQSN